MKIIFFCYSPSTSNKTNIYTFFVVEKSFNLIWPNVKACNNAFCPVWHCSNSIEDDTLLKHENEAEPVECGKVLQNHKQKMLSCVKGPIYSRHSSFLFFSYRSKEKCDILYASNSLLLTKIPMLLRAVFRWCKYVLHALTTTTTTTKSCEKTAVKKASDSSDVDIFAQALHSALQ